MSVSDTVYRGHFLAIIELKDSQLEYIVMSVATVGTEAAQLVCIVLGRPATLGTEASR